MTLESIVGFSVFYLVDMHVEHVGQYGYEHSCHHDKPRDGHDDGKGACTGKHGLDGSGVDEQGDESHQSSHLLVSPDVRFVESKQIAQ